MLKSIWLNEKCGVPSYGLNVLLIHQDQQCLSYKPNQELSLPHAYSPRLQLEKERMEKTSIPSTPSQLASTFFSFFLSTLLFNFFKYFYFFVKRKALGSLRPAIPDLRQGPSR